MNNCSWMWNGTENDLLEFAKLCVAKGIDAAISEVSEGGDGLPYRIARIDYVAIAEEQIAFLKESGYV